MTTRIDAHMTKPTTLIGRWLFQSGRSLRWPIQKRTMPSCDKEKVKKTLIEYMTTSASTLPRV